MRLYETTFIVNPQTDDASIDRQVQAISELITSRGGKIVREDRIGTRRMSYPIKGLGQGYYASFIFEAPVEVLPELERLYKIEDAYIRYLTILYEGDPNAEPTQRDAFARTFEEGDERNREGRDGRGGGRGFHRGDRDRDRDDRYEDRPRRGGGGRHFGGDQSIARQEAGPAKETAAPEEAPEAENRRPSRGDEEL